MAMEMPCPHVNVVAVVVDQTLGVACNDCNSILAYCWRDEHCSEALWNRAAALDPENCKPCTQDRADVCFLCGVQFTVEVSS